MSLPSDSILVMRSFDLFVAGQIASSPHCYESAIEIEEHPASSTIPTKFGGLSSPTSSIVIKPSLTRSEERRVGKGCNCQESAFELEENPVLVTIPTKFV